MKKILLLIFVFTAFFSKIGLADVFYNDSVKRIYITGTILKKDIFVFKRYIDKAESVFMNSQGGLGTAADQMINLIVKKKLPVYLGTTCYSACTLMAFQAPKLFANEYTTFLIHDPRTGDVDYENYTYKNMRPLTGMNLSESRQWLLTRYTRAGINVPNLVDELKELYKTDWDWEILLTCDQLKGYFKKGRDKHISCVNYSSLTDAKLIAKNNPGIKKYYCISQVKKIIVMFYPGCPSDYKDVSKKEFESSGASIINEFTETLVYPLQHGDIERVLLFVETSSKAGISVDIDKLVKEYGFKSFKHFIKEYSRTYRVKIKPKEAMDLFQDIDMSFQVDYSQENLNKLYKNIFSTKRFQKHRKKYEKAEWGKALSVCINLKKELARLTVNPSRTTVAPFAYNWTHSAGWWTKDSLVAFNQGFYDGAIVSANRNCKKSKDKYKQPLCTCTVIDLNGVCALSEKRIKSGDLVRTQVRFEGRKNKIY